MCSYVSFPVACLEVKPGRAVSFWQEKSKKTVSLATFNQVRGGNRLQICLREVIFARFNYCMLAEYQPEFRVESLQLSLQNVSCQRRIAMICPDGGKNEHIKMWGRMLDFNRFNYIVSSYRFKSL